MSALSECFAKHGFLKGNPLADDMGGPATRVHDWRNYVGALATMWPSLSVETRMAVAIVAEQMANDEEWD